MRVEGGVVQEVAYEAEVPHLFDTLIYEPVTAGALRGAAVVRRLQSGSLRTYLLYLLGLVALLVVLVAVRGALHERCDRSRRRRAGAWAASPSRR